VYRRVATTIFLPSRPGDMVSGQLVTIDPLELAVAEERDAGIGQGISQELMWGIRDDELPSACVRLATWPPLR
jgi:hypothetical protein